MTSVLCFYHSPCNDGSASAAALQHRLQQANYREGDYDIRFCPLTYTTEWDQPLPENYLDNEVMPKHAVSEIFIVDLSLSKVKFEQIIEHLRSHDRIDEGELPRVVCIDHHSTALDKVDELNAYCDETYIKIGAGLSGATLVWNYFNDRLGEARETPLLLQYVADQDIWEWKLEKSKEVNAALNLLNGTVEDMSVELDACLESPERWLAERTERGGAIVAMVEAQVHRAARQVAELPAEETILLVVNSTSFNSELGNYLCEHHENSPNAVALIYTIQDDWALRCSVRSIPGGKVTARQIAEKFGGGGHEHAAGCRFPDYAGFRAALIELQGAAATAAGQEQEG